MTNTLNIIVRWIANTVLDLLAAVGLDSPNRIVIALSPAFVAFAGFLLALVARYLPFAGRYLSPDQLVNVFELGAGMAAAKILVWLHGWQKHEARQPRAAIPCLPPGHPRLALAPDPPVPAPASAEDPAAQAA